MSVEYQIQGSGPPLVYVSGLEGSGKLFYKQSDDLARDHTVITFPLRGDGRYSMEELVDDLHWVVRETGFESVTVLGESFGGLLSMATALAHPRLFERMILVNTFPFFTQRAKIKLGVVLFSNLPYVFMKAHRTRAARRVLFSPDVQEEDRRLFREHTRVVPREGYVSRMRIIRDTDIRQRLHEIDVPTLVVAGTADRLLDSVGAAKLMVERLPRARLKLLEGTGHLALISQRVRVRDWLAEFADI
ncbi:MAG TPA: alpha/beta hydrolase [Pyrinomonadaceae bacterium]|jgi:pimeloyl-ACP methyl ester carboxylesterase